jgi:hypothetical protein
MLLIFSINMIKVKKVCSVLFLWQRKYSLNHYSSESHLSKNLYSYKLGNIKGLFGSVLTSPCCATTNNKALARRANLALPQGQAKAIFGRAPPAVLCCGSRSRSGKATNPGFASIRAKGLRLLWRTGRSGSSGQHVWCGSSAGAVAEPEPEPGQTRPKSCLHDPRNVHAK